MIIIDNYFEFPLEIRNYALKKIKYSSPSKFDGWRGYRSNHLSYENIFENQIISKVNNTIRENTKRNVLESVVCFHCTPEKIMFEEKEFHKMKWHKDQCDYAALVYLTPDPPKNTGTCIGNDYCVDNVYNRFVGYSGNIIHAPDHLFGDDLQTTRLTLTMFFGLE